MIGIDTTALIDLYKENDDLIKLLSGLTEPICTTVINSLEINFGLSSTIFFELSSKGILIGKFDCMIAGTLLSNGIDTIITKNKKHFEKIKGLKVLSY
ncbi:type II toxin-antitoxin system VapC family toxin [Candidatus Pacearchaeota archaeon]|nr:type II toxin-antitoxin system VapC family toxin [Candidatus Pacearchaeota archaeon]